MKVAYIAETSLTNKSAYTQHVIKMCDAFSNTTSELILLLPNVDKNFNYRNLQKKFLLTSKKKFKVHSILGYKVKGFILRSLFSFKAANYLRLKKIDLILTRSFITSFFLSLFKIKHFLEIHSELTSLTKFIMINLNFINSKYIIKIILISNIIIYR